MIGSTTMDFLIAQKIVPAKQNPHRRKWFIFSLVLNFTILAVFKYFDFFVGSLVGMFGNLGLQDTTGYYNWLYALRRLFRDGSRPLVVAKPIVLVPPTPSSENAVRQMTLA